MFIAKPGDEKLQDLPKWPALPEASAHKFINVFMQRYILTIATVFSLKEAASSVAKAKTKTKSYCATSVTIPCILTVPCRH